MSRVRFVRHQSESHLHQSVRRLCPKRAQLWEYLFIYLFSPRTLEVEVCACAERLGRVTALKLAGMFTYVIVVLVVGSGAGEGEVNGVPMIHLINEKKGATAPRASVFRPRSGCMRACMHII